MTTRHTASNRIKMLKDFDLELQNVLESKKDCTLRDYVEWYGAFDFQTLPFSDADALVLSLVVYFDLETLLTDENASAKLKDFYGPFKNGCVPLRITGGDMGNGGVMEAAIKSKRFGELTVSGCADVSSISPPLQFAAAVFTCPGLFKFIAFRGTDSSISGWKENFMISFTKTRAQELSAEYASKHIVAGPESYYVGGHSKGGNLALYASVNLEKGKQALVERIFILDGPGICPDLLPEDAIAAIDGKTVRVVPEFDIVGGLFPLPFKNTKVVRSFRSGVTQHSLPSWLIEKGRLSEAKEISRNSLWLSNLLTDWILSLDIDKRAGFINELFGCMEDEGVKDLDELTPDELTGIVIKIVKKENSSARLLAKIPEKLIFDGILEDIGREQTFTERHFQFIISVVFLLVALIMIIGASKILEIVSIGIAAAMTLLQIILTIRHVSDPSGSKEGLRERLILTAGAIGLMLVLLIKEQALFILGSLIFSILFFVLAFTTGERVTKEKNRFLKVLCIVETVFWSLSGAAFLLLPQAWIKILSIVSGSLLALFAVIRLVYMLVNLIRRKKAGRSY
ncbi:MAG: DUF2974 domain-containing protein [Clostridia bacterium]|nr:DUF2974 domain-containing protein [Clostridia bacterium]